jgi:hypothetical protein
MGNTYKAYRSGKPQKKANAPSASKKRGLGQADARSFEDFGEHVGGVMGDVLMGDGMNIHDKGHDSAHHGPDVGRDGASPGRK